MSRNFAALAESPIVRPVTLDEAGLHEAAREIIGLESTALNVAQ